MSDLSPDDPMAPPANTDNLDLNKLSPQELKLYRLYGKLPSKQSILQSKLKDRKYFDSGDYVMQKAGKAGAADINGGVGNKLVNYDHIQQINRNNSIVNGYVKKTADSEPDDKFVNGTSQLEREVAQE